MASDRFQKALRGFGGAASLVDRAVVAAMQARGRHERARADAMPHADRLAALAEIRSAYGDEALALDPARLFPAPPPVDVALRRVRPGVWDASWASAFEPFLQAVAERYLSRIENRTARARLFLASAAEATSSRPAVIAVHGYMGGHWLLEENAWPIEWLLRRGLDVALPVLPMHAARGGARRVPGASARAIGCRSPPVESPRW